jgi:hypothetical protein
MAFMAVVVLAVKSALPSQVTRITALSVVVGATLLACGIHALALFIGRADAARFIPIRLSRHDVRTATSGT